MKLLELFSSYYPFTIRKYDDDQADEAWEAYFRDSDDKKVTVQVTILAIEDPETGKPIAIATMNFERDGHEQLSGDGREVAKLFGTVIKATEKIINQLDYPIDVFTFAGDMTHGGRVKLYKHLVDRFAKVHGMKPTAPEWLMKALGDHIDPHTKPFYLSR